MPEINTNFIPIKESERLGPFQRKILDLLENELDGLTTNQMLEEIYRIPTMLGTLLHVSTDLRLFLSGEGKKISREEVIEVAEKLIIKVQDYLLAEDVDYVDKGRYKITERLTAASSKFTRFQTYLDYSKLQKLHDMLQDYIEISADDDAETTHESIFQLIIQTIRIGERVQGFRRELRVLRAAGEQESEEKTRRKILVNRLRANLGMTLSTLEKRDLVLENTPVQGAYWKGRPSRFVITERGYRLLQRAKAA